jgi:hypothetical protein
MPDTWGPVTYFERAKAWREKAAALPEDDPNRAPCVEIAEGYERLAGHERSAAGPARGPGGLGEEVLGAARHP